MQRPLICLAATVAALVPLAAACSGDDDAAATAPPPAANVADGQCRTNAPTPEPNPGSYDAPEQVIDPDTTYRAVLDTSCGEITVELDATAAPITVNSFVFLAREGFFNGLTFHRVVPGFVIQGGDPTGTGTGGPGYSLEDELPGSDGYAAGDLAMANAGPNTAGSQFFIVTGTASSLPGAYSLFGRVTEGLDVARQIESLAQADANPGDPSAQQPSQPVYIYGVAIEEE